MLVHPRVCGAALVGGLLLGCQPSVLLPSDSSGEATGEPAQTSAEAATLSSTAGTTVGTSLGPTTGTPTSGPPPVTSTTTGPDETTTGFTAGSSVGSGESTWSQTSIGFFDSFGTEGPIFIECSVWDQDCPEGTKCAPWANDGGNAWNATKCAPVDPNAGAVGDACVVEGSWVSGIDTCALGSICWGWGDGPGVCVGQCTGSENDPSCPEGLNCSIVFEGVIAVCLPSCDPLLQDCGDGHGCYATDEVFGCWPDISGDTGGYPDACEYITECDPGSGCFNGAVIPGCRANGCCSPWCDTTLPGTCPGAGQTCTAYFLAGQAPVGQENIGFCGSP